MNTLRRKFIHSVAWILIITSLAKIYSAAGAAKVLDIPDALLPMSIRQGLWLVGAIELIVVLVLLMGKNEKTKLVLIGWLAGNFLLYRLASIMLTVGKPCPCLGSVTEMLPLKPATVDGILSGVVVYLLFGSLLFLFAFKWRRRPSVVIGEDEVPAISH